MSKNKEKQSNDFVLEMNIWHENQETGQKDVMGKRVVERFPSGFALSQFRDKNKKIIRKGEALTRRLKQLNKARVKNAIETATGSEIVDELITNARRSVGD